MVESPLSVIDLIPNILLIIAIIISIIALYRNTRLVCKIGIHRWKEEGSQSAKIPIEHHRRCLKCGKTETVYQK